jgi:tetratricopeptide (TPR) repeat protein
MSKRRESIALALAGSVAMGAGLVFAIPRMGGLLRNADEGRVSAFAAAVQIFRHFPLVGSGPGSYATERMAYPAEALSQLTLPDPHNGILAALSDTGLAGVVTLLIVAFVVVRLLARGLRTSDRSFAVAAVVGIAAISLHRMMDLVFMLPGLLIASMFVIGIAMRSRPNRRESRRSRLAATAFAAVALTLTVASAPKVITAEQGFDAYRVATAAWDAGDVRGAAGLAGDSLAQAPDLVPSQQLASMIALREGRADDAVDHAADAARREPMAQNLVRLATALSTAGRLDESGEMLARATAVKPADPVALLNAAMRGPASDRGPTLQHLLEVEPELAAFGDSMPNASAADFTAAIESAHASLFAAGSTSQALRLALAAEREDLAQADVEAMSGPSQTVARLLMQGWFGDVEAASNLDTLATAEPDLASDAAYRLAGRSCDETNADRWASVITVQYGAPPAIIVGVAAAPALRTGAYPDRYPVWVWSVFGTTPAYPDGMWGIDWRSGVTCLTASAH